MEQSKIKKVLILCRREDRAEFDTAKSMADGLQSAASDDAQYTPCNYEDLIILFDGNTVHINDDKNIDIQSYDVIFQLGWFKSKLIEDIALAVAMYAERHGITHHNQEALHNRSSRKISQYVAAALNGVQTIPFVFAHDYQKMLPWAKACTLPLIVKDAAGNRGNNNHLVKSLDEIERILAASPDVPFLIQDFIENDGDYRLLVAGDQVKLAMLRKASDGSHLNNISKGGTGELVVVNKLGSEMLQDAVKIARVLRREFAGIDMVIDKKTGRHYLLEANNMPQISTGSNTTMKLQILHEYLISTEDL